MEDIPIPEHIKKALRMPLNYSHEFSDRVIAIGKILSKYLGTSLLYDGDMNYRAGQSLSFSLLSHPPYKFSERGDIAVGIYFSSRSELFCFFCVDEMKKFVGHDERKFFVSPEKFPDPIQKIIDQCRNILNDIGFIEVENKFLTLNAPDCFTELDELPATIFQVLFAEIT
jgi:hypothetical protein